MAYTIDFCVISAAYLSFTAFFYGRQKKLPSLRNRLFGVLLVLGIASLVLDIAAALLDSVAASFPAWVVYAANILFLTCTQLSGPVFFFYTLVITGYYQRMRPWLRAAVLLPLACTVFLICISPFVSWGAFYLDGYNTYLHGPAHAAMYVSMAAYIVTSGALVLCARRSIQKRKIITITSFLLFSLLAMLVQLTNPYLLVNSMANAIVLTIMYHVLQPPSEHIDAQTGAFNRAALPLILQDYYEQHQRFSLLVLPLADLGMVNYAVGMKNGDLVLRSFAKHLEANFGTNVLRIAGDVFAVIFEGGQRLTLERTARLQSAIPTSWATERLTVSMNTNAAGLNSEDFNGTDEMLDVIAGILQLHGSELEQRVVMADAAFKAELAKQDAMEAALMRAIDGNNVQVHYQPIHDANGRLVAMEALARIIDEKLGFIPPDVFIRLSEQNGSVMRLGEQVLRKVCAFIREYNVQNWGLKHLGVNLSAIQCMDESLPDMVARIMAEYDIEPGLIAFEITETEAAESLNVVHRNMVRMAAAGYYFLLDDFGTGYANFNYIAKLPFACVKIDKHLLWTALEDPAKMGMLISVNNILRRLSLDCVCEGVETAEQADCVARMGIGMQQGFYYSKALPPDALAAYAGREARA